MFTLCSDLCDECNSKVAVKIIRLTNSNARNVHAEVEISLMLNHPNCIKTYRVFDYKDSVYMVQELATGGDLCDYLGKHGPIADERILKVWRAIYCCWLDVQVHSIFLYQGRV